MTTPASLTEQSAYPAGEHAPVQSTNSVAPQIKPQVSMNLWRVLAYGVFGLPLAFAALPIYVHLPRLYGEFVGISLGVLGVVLLLARLGDAFIDPVLGVGSDRWQQAFPRYGRRSMMALTVPFFALGLWLLLNPPPAAGVGWLSMSLALTYLGFSMLTITYQAWGADMADSTASRSRLTASREGFGLVGVMLAASLPSLLASELPRGLSLLANLFIPLLLISTVIALFGGRVTASRIATLTPAEGKPFSLRTGLSQTWSDSAFRHLLMVFVVSGVAAALPATLVMFYVADVIKAEADAGGFLAIYFAAGLLGLPFWVRWARRRGTLMAWRDGMLLACLAFCAAPFLGAGDRAAFALVCVLSGLALGADLVLPATHLADLAKRHTATYFGLWNFASKLNLALAAGIALPLLAVAGYQPGEHSADNNVVALAIFYGGLPLIGKLLAAFLVQRWHARMSIAA